MRRPPAAAPTKGGGALRAPPPFVGSYFGGIPSGDGRGNFIHLKVPSFGGSGGGVGPFYSLWVARWGYFIHVLARIKWGVAQIS